MDTQPSSWPHAPEHRLCERGTYIVTCGTYRKQHFLNTPDKLTLARNLLFELADKYKWNLQAWAIMSNHYHFVAASPEDPATLKKMLSTLHTLTARDLNRMDHSPKRRVWYNYYDSHITYEKSWLARLKYVHHNPAHHGVVQNAERYEWCSAAWFAREASNAFVKTVNSFKVDQVKVYDEFDMECAGSTPLSNTAAKHMECAGPKADEAARLRFKTADAQPSESGVKPPQSKSGVESLRDPSDHRTPKI